jgi:two-component system sensor histidine kinase MprB
MPERLSLAARITLLASAAVGLTVAVVALVVYALLRNELVDSVDESLERRAKVAAGTGLITISTLRGVSPEAFAAADMRILVISEEDSVAVPESEPLQVGDAEFAVAAGERQQSIRTISSDGTDYRVVAVPAGPGTALVLAVSMEPTERTLERLGLVLWLIGIAGVAVAAASGWAVANNGLRPVRRLTAAAERVARTEQLRPIEVTGNDELARLTTAFNSMLVALDASRTRQRQLVADAGHELRTPLTSLRTNIELLSQADRSGGLEPTARAELLDDVQGQLLELTSLVGDLVQLARDEPLRTDPAPVDLADVVRTSIERVRRRAHGVRFEEDLEPWMVHGEAVLLERAVTNLLDNAVKWSPPQGTVRVALHDGRLTVADSGPGIDEEDRPHVFDRFYRSPEARTLPGSGLGLAIVAQTARRHGGVVDAASSDTGGALLTLRLPGQSVTQASAAASAPGS